MVLNNILLFSLFDSDKGSKQLLTNLKNKVMKKIILYKNGFSLSGSDQLMYIDGRLNITSIKKEVEKRNQRFFKNLPQKIADGFRFCDNRLNEYGSIITL